MIVRVSIIPTDVIFHLFLRLGSIEQDENLKEEYFLHGKTEMEEKFGARARQYTVYGKILHNLSVICINQAEDSETDTSICETEGQSTDTTWRNRNMIESLRRTRPDSKNTRDISCLTSALSFGILD